MPSLSARSSFAIEHSTDGEIVFSGNWHGTGVSIPDNRIKRNKVSKVFFQGFCFIIVNSPFCIFTINLS